MEVPAGVRDYKNRHPDAGAISPDSSLPECCAVRDVAFSYQSRQWCNDQWLELT
jgi:hypothetical protein